jgi:predicted aspartyl protease
MPSTLLLLLTLATAHAVPLPTQPVLGASECRLRIGTGGIPLVRVRVTSERDAWFVLDTGASGTTIHVELARRLGLAPTGEARLHTVEGTSRVATVRLQALAIVGWPVTHALDAAVHDMALVRHAVPEAEGILGQDVLSRYDYLIDPRRGRLTIGRFSAPMSGVRVPLVSSAGRPVLLMDHGPDRYGLVLDTGADVLVMEAGAARQAIGDVSPVSRTRGVLQTHLGARSVEVEHHVGVRMANVDLPPLALVRLPTEAWAMSPEVGLLPASVFSRVYVSARQGEAVVWQK